MSSTDSPIVVRFEVNTKPAAAFEIVAAELAGSWRRAALSRQTQVRPQ